jgi:fission 1 protein
MSDGYFDLTRHHAYSNCDEGLTLSADLKRFEARYNEEMAAGKVSPSSQFEYAWCLVRSKYPSDIRKGILLLEDLYQNRDQTGKRDYLYYLAIGNARIKEYQLALKYIRGLLQVEPGNRQAQDLENIIKSKMAKEGLIGMAVVGGATLALGGLVGLGIALAKSARK